MTAQADSPATPPKGLQRSVPVEAKALDEGDIPDRAVWASEQGDIQKRVTSISSMVTRCVSDSSAATREASEGLDTTMAESAELDDEEDDGIEDDDGIVIEGPLEQLKFLTFWRPRWCVLDRFELRIYRSEEACRQHPDRPRQRISTGTLDAEIWCGAPEQLTCYKGDRPAATFRTGKRGCWEEGASARLWLSKIASVV
mmetsp:Transcript_107836/g.310632  ORF Transcript_107836/g.310632 Transcript_107836/m.310632 type:complete len:199 (-) Transcript_107836:106-702(-)